MSDPDHGSHVVAMRTGGILTGLALAILAFLAGSELRRRSACPEMATATAHEIMIDNGTLLVTDLNRTSYSFEHQGATYFGEAPFHVPQGETIAVRFDPADPHRSTAEPAVTTSFWIALAIMALGFVGIFANRRGAGARRRPAAVFCMFVAALGCAAGAAASTTALAAMPRRHYVERERTNGVRSICLTVTCRGEPVADARVEVWLSDTERADFDWRTDAHGRVVAGLLPSGPLFVTVAAEGFRTRRMVPVVGHWHARGGVATIVGLERTDASR